MSDQFHGETDRLAPGAAPAIRSAIRLSGGREVCFVCTINDDGVVQTARVAARGDVGSVLALPGFANRGELLVHNHPSGCLEPSGADRRGRGATARRRHRLRDRRQRGIGE